MGILDTFSKEDRIEITVSQFHDIMKESVKAELILDGLKAKVSEEDLLSIFDTERKQKCNLEALHDIED